MYIKRSLIIIFSTLILIVMSSLFLTFQLLETEEKITEEEEDRYASYLLADELRQTSDDLTRMVRTYVVTGDSRYERYFQNILNIRNGVSPRPFKSHRIYWDLFITEEVPPRSSGKPYSLKRLMQESNFTDSEFAFLRDSEKKSNHLVGLENRAMNSMKGLYQDSSGEYTRRDIPNPKLARELVYGKEYHDAKSKIMKSLEKFFDSIEKRAQKNILFYKKKKDRLAIVLISIIVLSILLLFISGTIVLFFMENLDQDQKVSLDRSFIKTNFWSSWPFLMLSIVSIFMVCSLFWWFLHLTQTLNDQDIKVRLENQLNSAYDSTVNWFENISSEINLFSRIISKNISHQSFQEIQTGNSSGFTKEFKSLDILESPFFSDYMILDSNKKIIIGSHKEIKGESMRLPEELFHKKPRSIFYTNALFSQKNNKLNEILKNKFVFVTYLEKEKISLVFLLSPEGSLDKIFQSYWTVSSHDIYMVNIQGRLVNESRWLDRIKQKKLVQDDEKFSSIGLELSDPVTGELINSVKSVIKGKGLSSWSEYTNYLGDQVVGVWRWNHVHKFGIISEIKSKEAFSVFSSYYKSNIFQLIFTITLILLLTFIFIGNRLKLSKINKKLDDTYKVIKEQKNKLDKDLKMGQKIQQGMLPEPIEKDWFSLSAYLKPAQTMSGDFYDFAVLNDNQVYFCVGDVSGKGVGAALFMSMTKSLLKRSLEQYKSLNTAVIQTNKQLCYQNESCMFVTLLLGLVDFKEKKMYLCNAGHNPPYLKKKTGEVICLEKVDGPLVGAFSEANFDVQSISLSQGDSLLFYTDGVTEAQNTKQEFYGDDKLAKFFKNKKFSSPQAAVDEISQDVIDFMGKASQFDDITILSFEHK